MSEEIHVPEHSSLIKTPKQLAIVVFLAFAIPITVIVMLAHLVISGMDPRANNPGLSDEAIAKRLKPVGEVVVMSEQEREAKAAAEKEAKPAAAPPPPAAMAKAPGAAPAAAATGDSAKGQSVYAAACAACHTAGVAGAPKLGDKAGWAARLKSGTDALYAAAIKGKGAMPPKGGNTALSDADVKAAVDYMLNQVK